MMRIPLLMSATYVEKALPVLLNASRAVLTALPSTPALVFRAEKTLVVNSGGNFGKHLHGKGYRNVVWTVP
jgi:hypothetical protein